ncbi:potassium transporter [Leucosporidium creatinivorum]|uniref:Potassium transporter n=1 Tax=Leucosporidium creatinivorum TaxID=106004 RepID=A0A1Y2F8N1_9BASI|nr:potassium transporter [Leucosporidium creatinivorum]
MPADPEAAATTPRQLKSASSPPKGLRATALLAALSLGVIYGDIGTSPLYVLNAVFPSSGPVPSKEDIIGAVSAVIWAITIVPLIKYALIALSFGNATGEGGPFALYTSLFPPREESDGQRTFTRHRTFTSVHGAEGERFIDRPFVKASLYAWVLFGTSLTISDGLLTPAVSVTSAVTGIAVAAPSVAHSVVPISIAILVVLFLVQGFGTRRVGVTFAPIVFIWLGINAISGIINITAFPGIFRAFDPSRAVMLFVRTKNFDLLAGVLLAITGVEAMFANLAQFGPLAIRVSFIGWVYPCLLLAYLGQGAKLVTDPSVLSNVFFASIPGGVGGGYWWFSWVFAVMAAVIASQAMITATFSLVQQLTRLHAMPAVKIIHTADDVEGQIYAPAVNVLLMIGTIALTAGFGTDVALTNAYGFAVSGVMIVTTSFLAIALVYIRGFPFGVGIWFFIFAGFFDALFWGASLKKVPHGAWFPLGMAVLLAILFILYSWAKKLELTFDLTHRHRLNDVMRTVGADRPDAQAGPMFASSLGEKSTEMTRPVPVQAPSYEAVGRSTALSRLPIFAFFHNPSASTLGGAPHSFSAFLRCYPSLPQVIIFFNVQVVGVAHTFEEERYLVSRIRSFEGMYIATLRLGYRDPIDLASVASPIRDLIVELERHSGEGDVARKIALIDASMEHAVTHILPRFYVTAADSSRNKVVNYVRRFLIESVYRRVAVNFDEYDQFKFANEEDVLRMGVSASL